ncbi:MAG: Atu2307/SP_0267 family LLM class monooxygenase [Bacteroidota bacterium]
MEIGIDTFAGLAHDDQTPIGEAGAVAVGQLLDRIVRADELGLDLVGIGEHHRREFLDSAAVTLLSAAAARTERIRLSSAVTVLSAADPVRVFQQFASLDLISNGRAEIVAGRGSFTEAFPLFGYSLRDYDDVYAEKLELLLKLRDEEVVTWSGRFRPALDNQGVYPRPVQDPLPIWIGVGGTPASFARAGVLGLPLMVAIIGGEPRRFRPLVDLYRRAWTESGHPADQLRVGVHFLGYVGETTKAAVADYFPGYARMFSRIGRERGWPPVSRAQFDALRGPTGALLVGGPEEVAAKILRHSEALGGIDRVTLQMDHDGGEHAGLLRSVEWLGSEVAPRVRAHQTMSA